MNRKVIYSFAVITLLLSVFITSCKQDKPKQESPYTDYELAMTNRDTTAVTQLIDQFFGYLESDRLSDAVAMLYKIDENDVEAEPQLLDNEQLARVTRTYRMLMPVRSHHIDYIKFNEAYNNEVKVTIVLEEAAEGQPAMTTVMYFRPYDYLANWRLCVMTTEDRDKRIISNAQADSMQQRYNEELEQKTPHAQ